MPGMHALELPLCECALSPSHSPIPLFIAPERKGKKNGLMVTFGLLVTIADKCLSVVAVVERTEHGREANGQEGDHAADEQDDEAQRELFAPCLLNLLVVDATHAHERWEGPAGGDP